MIMNAKMNGCPQNLTTRGPSCAMAAEIIVNRQVCEVNVYNGLDTYKALWFSVSSVQVSAMTNTIEIFLKVD